MFVKCKCLANAFIFVLHDYSYVLQANNTEACTWYWYFCDCHENHLDMLWQRPVSETFHRQELINMTVFRWSTPPGARRVMDAVMEGHKSSLSSGKMVALAAGLSVGATVGYMVYRHMSSTNTSEWRLVSHHISVWVTGSALVFSDNGVIIINRPGPQHWSVEDDASCGSL